MENTNPPTQLAKALARAEAQRVADGRPARAVTRGPLAVMLVQAGLNREQVLTVCDKLSGTATSDEAKFTGPVKGWNNKSARMFVGAADRMAFAVQTRRVLAEAGL